MHNLNFVLVCHLSARIDHWKDHNLTDGFGKFCRLIQKYTSKVVNVLHNRYVPNILIIINILRFHIQITNPQWYTRSRNRKFSAFGLRFRPPKVKAEYGRNSRKALDFFFPSIANVNYQW